MFSTEDTIVAIATPPGRGGLGVVRISGPAARSIASGLARRETFEPRHATLARIADEQGAAIDEAIITFFPAPHSYTGEDVIELSAHGSPVVLDAIVRAALAAGARARDAAKHGVAEEFVLADLHEARACFDEVTGARTPDDVLRVIFERFCIGK